MLKTYVPLYRKYRPQTFKDLVGQEAISKTLSNAIVHNKVAHAYLFTGPRGTGKTSTARILAKSLNCEKGPTVTPCDECSTCLDITSGNALDVIEIDAASNNKVEDARDLIDRVQFAPVSGRYKVYIIDEVHMLTSQAFNTLLKTLEEPPPNLVFILATTEAHKVLETIISRCQRFDFRRISQDAMVERLVEVSEKEKIVINREALNVIARRSAGGLRDALGLLDQISVLSNIGEAIEVKDVLNLIGALPEDMLLKLSRAIAEKDGSQALQLINELMSMGNEPIQIIKEITIHFRNLLIAATVKQNLKDIIDASEEFFDDIKQIAKCFKTAEIAQIIDKLAYTERMIRSTTQPILWFEVGILSICYRHEILLVEELQKRVEELECIVASGSVPPAMTVACERKKTDSKLDFKPQPALKPADATIEPVKVQSAPVREKTVPAKFEAPPETIAAEVKLTEPKEKPAVAEVKLSETELNAVKPEKPEHKEEIVQPSVPEAKPEPLPVSLETDSFESYEVDSTWQAIVNAIESPSTKGLLASLVMPMAITGQEIILGFSQEWVINDMNRPNRKEMLESAVKKVIGKVPRVIFKLMSEKDYKSPPPSKLPEQKKTVEKPVQKPESKPVELQKPVKKESGEVLSDKSVSLSPEAAVNELIEVRLEPEYSEQVKLVKDLFHGKILNQ